MKKKRAIIKKAARWPFTAVAGASTIAGVLGYSIKDLKPSWPWWLWSLILLIAFTVLFLFSLLIIIKCKHRPYTTEISKITVRIKTGDLFAEPQLKVIPFNERFDTEVDDKIIAHSSLNGIMIDKYVDDLEDLRNTIKSALNENSKYKPQESNGNLVYPLGRLIEYKDFLMLSFTHFDNQNRAYIGIGEYEQMLMRMWDELRRVYAGKPIAIPLIGSGITTIKGMPEKNYTEMLKCILCTLRKSGFQPEKGISIVLTEDVMEKVDMNIIKEEF